MATSVHGNVSGALRPQVDLALAVRAARAAGELVRTAFASPVVTEAKGSHDVVTATDRASEALLAEILLGEGLPGDALLGEEGGARGVAGASRLWIVDPIDGTVNFANGIPLFAVAIGLVVDGEPLVGVVYDPIRDELFAAERGAGATLNGAPIHVSAKRSLGESVCATSLQRGAGMALVASIALAARSTRALGTSAIALAWVAAGRIDAYVQDANLSLWDIAGPGVIAVEAGAVVEGLNGEPWLNLDAAKESRIIASTPGIVAEVRSAIGSEIGR